MFARDFEPIYLTAEIRAIETRAATLASTPRLSLAGGEPTPSLMEKAGRAIAERVRVMLGDGNAVLLLAGPGNNGGDALVAARWLLQWWFKVDIVLLADIAKLSDDASQAWRALTSNGHLLATSSGKLLTEIPAAGEWDLIVDGLFGIGLTRDLTGTYAECIARANRMNAPVLAIDIPSGLDADTGRVLGAAIRARETISFIGLKPGLLTADGPDYCGKIRIDTLGVDATAATGEIETMTPAAGPPRRGRLNTPALFASALTPRPINSHKGRYGSLAVIGGARGMTGAALLAGRAALMLGAGKIHLGLLAADSLGVDANHPEFMIASARDVLEIDALTCLTVGTGLGQSPAAAALLEAALARRLPLVLDADALNLIAAYPPLQQALIGRAALPAASVLTPHPGEAARLLNLSTKHVQHDRLRAACAIARRFQAFVVLKGAGSICACPNGAWFINSTGNPGMASGGMGDALTGMIGALLGRQGSSPRDALLCAVYVHGAAADEMVRRGAGPVGLTASEVAAAARDVFNRLIAGFARP